MEMKNEIKNKENRGGKQRSLLERKNDLLYIECTE
jgi:hypothetical protein